MRLGLQFLILVAVTAFLALQIPRKAIFKPLRNDGVHASVRPHVAAYVELDDEVYANRMKIARMAWQVRARTAGRLDLEDDTPLAWEAPPPPKAFYGLSISLSVPTITAEPPREPSLAPPSLAAPPAAELPALEDRRRDALLDLSPYETLGESNL